MEKKKVETGRITRRSFIRGFAASAVLTGVGIPTSSKRAKAASGTLDVMINGGDWEKLARKLVVAPFEKKYGVTVSITPGSSSQMLARLRAERQSPSQDVVVIDLGPAFMGIREGLFEKINSANIPNLKDLDEMAIDKEGYGPIVSSHSTGLGYNESLFKKPVPNSWMDLWNPIYKDSLLLSSITLTSGQLFLLEIAMLNGGSYENIDPGIQMIKKLKPNIRRFTANSAELRAALLGEDILGVCGPNLVAEAAKNSGMPIKPVFPKEGNVLSPATCQIVKGTKKKEWAEKFINEYLSPESQLGWVVDYNVAVFNKKVKIPPEMGQRLPSKNVLYDYRKISSNLEGWVEKFTREIKM
jgi:putative spermidine/putrescine transport system substrate-binding protein